MGYQKRLPSTDNFAIIFLHYFDDVIDAVKVTEACNDLKIDVCVDFRGKPSSRNVLILHYAT